MRIFEGYECTRKWRAVSAPWRWARAGVAAAGRVGVTVARAVGPDGGMGLTAAALIGSGTWALWGWAWAALALGVPMGLFHLYAELRKLGKAEG